MNKYEKYEDLFFGNAFAVRMLVYACRRLDGRPDVYDRREESGQRRTEQSSFRETGRR